MNDASGAPLDQAAYENTASEQWASQAFAYYQQGLLQVRAFDTDGVVSAQIWGTCPRCQHDLDVQRTLSAAVSEIRGLGDIFAGILGTRPAGSAIPPSIEVSCGCGKQHPGAPDHVKGCGVSFRLPAREPGATG